MPQKGTGLIVLGATQVAPGRMSGLLLANPGRASWVVRFCLGTILRVPKLPTQDIPPCAILAGTGDLAGCQTWHLGSVVLGCQDLPQEDCPGANQVCHGPFGVRQHGEQGTNVPCLKCLPQCHRVTGYSAKPKVVRAASQRARAYRPIFDAASRRRLSARKK